jgi:hypothetical protein
MDDSKLHSLLTALHRELKATDTVDPATRRLLEQIRTEISPIVEAAPGQGPAGAYAGLRNRLQAAVVEFEASHPQLARTIEGVVDSLASYNI